MVDTALPQQKSTTTTSFTITAAMTTTEQTIVTIDPGDAPALLAMLLLDVNAWENDVAIQDDDTLTVRLKQQIDGSNYRTVEYVIYKKGETVNHPAFFDHMFADAVRVTIQSSRTVNANAAIPISLTTGGYVEES